MRVDVLGIPDNYLSEWQNIVDIMAGIIGVPTGLVMRAMEDQNEIEVFVSSKTDGNPYHVGDKENLFGSGLYCETVIKSNEMLVIPNALNDENWKDNPDVKLNMISYLGYPLQYPDGTPFGTICVLDDKENHYSDSYKLLVKKFRDVIQNNIDMIWMNNYLGETNKDLIYYIKELKSLRKYIMMCAKCRKVKDEENVWHSLEDYISKETDSKFSHSVCPECINRLYPELKNE